MANRMGLMAPLIRYQEPYRDSIQSLLGTNPSADEIVKAHLNAHLTGVSALQVGGGTFYDIFAKKGRKEWEEMKTIISAYKDKGVKLSALIRGDFLFSYEPQPYDVIRAMVFEMAEMGINVLQNFHGMNDPRCLVGVVKAVKEAQAAGYDIVAQGTICIEDNPNITVEGCVEFARELIAMGHEDIYLKSASGRLDPDFVYELVGRLYDEFPDQEITIHAHSTYGEAPICYMAATKAAMERKKPITVDVAHPAMAGSTGHPSMLKMQSLYENHPDEMIRNNAPKLNFEAIKADMNSLYDLRFDYRDSESRYNKELLDAMRPARVPGGASATLRAIKNMESNMRAVLGTDDWDKMQIAVYNMQAKIDSDMGSPTQVTPFAANTTGQAAFSLVAEKSTGNKYGMLHQGAVNYLVGRHGRVPETVNKELQALALQREGLEVPVNYVLSTDRPDALPAAKEKLREAGIENPTDQQALSAILLDGGVDHVVACANGTNTPQQPPAIPFYAQEPPPLERRHQIKGVPARDIRDAVQAIGGKAKLQHIAESALHLKQLVDRLYKFPRSEQSMESKWYEGNVKKISELLDGISDSLEKDGFAKTQILVHELRSDNLPALSHQIQNDNLLACIKDACDHKGNGLFSHMMRAVEDYHRGILPDFSVHQMDIGQDEYTVLSTGNGNSVKDGAQAILCAPSVY